MRTVTLFLLTLLAVGASAEIVDDSNKSELSKKAVSIKQSVLELNRQLYQLEEDLLSPATTRAAIYFSLSDGEFFDPYSLDITFDGKQAMQYLYSERQLSALRQGAVQPLGKLNLGPGVHNIKAVAKGVDKNGIERKLVLEKRVEKHDSALYVEVKIQDNKTAQNAELVISQW